MDLDSGAPGRQDVGLAAGPPRGKNGGGGATVVGKGGGAGKVEPQSSGLGEEKPRLTA